MERKFKIDYDGEYYIIYELLPRPLPWNPYAKSWVYKTLYSDHPRAVAAVEEMLKFPQYFEGEPK